MSISDKINDSVMSMYKKQVGHVDELHIKIAACTGITRSCALAIAMCSLCIVGVGVAMTISYSFVLVIVAVVMAAQLLICMRIISVSSQLLSIYLECLRPAINGLNVLSESVHLCRSGDPAGGLRLMDSAFGNTSDPNILDNIEDAVIREQEDARD